MLGSLTVSINTSYNLCAIPFPRVRHHNPHVHIIETASSTTGEYC